MKKLLLTLAILFNVVFAFSQEVHKRIAINNPSSTLQQQISDKGIDLSCGAKHDHGKLILELSEFELKLLDDNGISYNVVIEDLTKFYRERIDNTYDEAVRNLESSKIISASSKTSSKSSTTSKSISSTTLDNFLEYVGCDEIDWATPTNFNLGSMGGCLTVSEMEAELDQMRSLYPGLISAKADASSTGITTWGNPASSITNNGLTYSGQGTTFWDPKTVYYVRITGNQANPEGTNPQSLFTSMIHAREVGSLMSNIYFMWYLLENYATNDAIKNLVDNNELYFIPVVNPDGLRWNEHLNSSGGGMQRKNCRPNTGSTSNSTSARGVDLNRNFDYFWGTAGSGSSGTASSDSYRGPNAFSEPETQILKEFVESRDFKTCLMNHTSGNAIPHPYGGNPTFTSGREDEMHKWHEDMTKYNRYVSGATIFTAANGIADDWMVGGSADANGKTGSTKTVLASTPEHGGTGFWPPTTDIVPIAKRAMRISLTTAYYAGKYAKLHDLTQSDINSLTSDLTFGIERLGQAASNFTINITPISSNITSIATIPAQTGMSILEQRNVTAQIVLNGSIAANDKIEYNVQLSDGTNVFYNVNFEKYYQPNVLLSDNPDSDLLTNWTTSGTWTASNATGAQYSGSRSIKLGNNAIASYGNNTTSTLTSASTYDLSGASETIIQFYTKWDLERNFDFVELLGSTDGSTWQSLCGKYNKPNSTSGTNGHDLKNSTSKSFQANNSSGRVYDGDRMDKWVMEEIVIDASNNSFLNGTTTAQFRFRFQSDSGNLFETYSASADGFFIDDFKITSIQVPCAVSVPTNVAVSNVTPIAATVSWDNIPSATYDLRYREVGSSTWTDVNGLTSASTNITGLTALTQYETQVRSNCTGGSSAYSTSVNFTTLDIQLNYCDSDGNNQGDADEYISNVQIKTINNTTGDDHYADYTSQSTSATIGETVTVTITPTWTGQVYSEGYSVWVDYNKNGDFTDAGEQVWTQAATQATSVSGNFTIPSGAVEGSTRVRVSMKYNAIPTSCESFRYGEVEDYTITIQSLVDTTAPVITLVGASTINLDVGDTYSEQGATASDDKDGDITANIVTTGSVDTNTAGTYLVNYNVSDAAGNAATQVTRTINVIPDTTAPVITLVGASTINLNVGDVYTEQGATASDDKDGDITASIITSGSVNTAVAGTYLVNYNVSDAAGNAATEVTRTVNVIPDTTAPVITLVGSSTINLNVGDLYTEQGATASDDKDGDITASIIISGSVNTASAGTYLVNYNVSDAAGNAATEVTRTVNVIPDTTAPIITLVGSSTINLNVGDVYADQGATANDNKDGDITGSIVVGGDTVNTNAAGTYVVTYNVSDVAGNAATEVTRTVNVIPDTTAPIITLVGASTININVGDTYTEQGATANDNKDGDITANIVVGGATVNTSVAGAYVVTYNVSDAAGNAATEVTRTVNVIPDTTAPVITLLGSSTINLDVGDVYTEQGATASDNKDGDITASIVTTGSVDTNTAGTYLVNYNVSDAAGNAATQVTRTVNVIPDTTAPVITLVGSSTINLDVGDVYTEQGATASDNKDGDITASIVTTGSVDTNTAGTYLVNYNVSDAAGNAATEVTRTVNVIPDTTAPVITLLGSSTINLNVGDVYTEQGATASDNKDGDITASIVTTGSVDTNTAGTYLVNYNVSDVAGNAATQVTRTVNVIPDTTAPVITLLGSSTINLNVGDVYTEQGATASDDKDGDITASIVTTGSVDTNAAGTYLVNYNVSDAAGNAAIQVTRTVNVAEVPNGCTGGISSFPYTEGFENTLGAWSQSSSDDLDWTIDINNTPSNNTGPNSAFQGSYYVFVEASGNNTGYPNKQAILNSPCFDLSTLTEATFSFKYHMYGDADMGTITLEISTDEGSNWTSIWNQTGNKGNSWQTANVDISAYTGGGVQLRFNRVTGGTWKADIAIDDVSLVEGGVVITPCSGGITSFPYTEGFENTLGAWTQSSSDDINWTVDANGTPSNNTGPSSAIQGSYYIFVEASGNATPSKQAIINSPCYDLSGQSSATFNFSYHMYGSSDMGTIALEASNDNGISWTSIWNESGNKGNSWQTANIDLSSYVGSSVQLRFNRITGGTWQADIAIDNINLTANSALAKNNLKGKVLDVDTNTNSVNTFKLYPNPVKGSVLNIKLSKGTNNMSYKIINMLGQVVNIGKTTKEVIVGDLEAGVYYIELDDGKEKMTKRFIKSN